MDLGDLMPIIVTEAIKEAMALCSFCLSNRVFFRKAFFAATGDHS